MTSIFKPKKSPYYYIKIKLPNGTWKTKSTGTKNKRLAEMILREEEWNAWMGAHQGTEDIGSTIIKRFKNIESVRISMKKKDFYGTIYGLADELRDRKEQGKCETYKEAWEYGEKNWTVNGKDINAKQLQNNYYKAISAGKL